MTLENFTKRHSEPAIIAIIENWERYAGLKAEATMPLELRWQRMMHNDQKLLVA